MNNIKQRITYKDLEIWQESHNLFFEIVEDSNKFPQNKAAWIIADQVIRSVGSISANIAEGSGRGTTKDLIRFLIVARGSLVESLNWIEKLIKLRYISQEKGNEYIIKLDHINKKINALIGSLRKRLIH